ncbi:MoaD/ThiS family protein [Flavihumibacter sp.]|uniref:MoaD/ThiS family protein n=1 Tax=Flavihumibacter sp. TaxID=1913981 RepID=UPI002FC5B9EC|nr:MoaD/ThiS family protein [Flavihumibacter sediminis]
MNSEINIMVFGQLAELTGSTSVKVNLPEDTDSLKKLLLEQFPALVNYNFIIAVDKRTITENSNLYQGATIAILPPFSGG